LGLVYHWRGIAYRGVGRLDDAIQDGESALKYIGSMGSEWEQRYKASLSLSYQLRGDKFWRAGGDLPKAVADYSRVIDLNPQTVWPRFGRAMFYYWNGRWQDAASDFSYFANLYRNEPHYSLALTLQGRCYLKLGNKNGALENVRKLIEIQPRLAAQYGGDAALDLYDVAKRRERAREALRLALAAEQSGNVIEAFQQYCRAREYPLISVLYPGIDWAAAGFEDYDGKDDFALLNEMRTLLLRLYLKLPAKPALPEEARRFAVPAGVAEKDGRYDDAIALYNKVLNLAPWWPQAYFNGALLLAQQKRYQEASYWMQSYLAFAPDASDARQAKDKIYEWDSLAAAGKR
jgi:tetratricopeptide (TPR) repeat protein